MKSISDADPAPCGSTRKLKGSTMIFVYGKVVKVFNIFAW